MYCTYKRPHNYLCYRNKGVSLWHVLNSNFNYLPDFPDIKSLSRFLPFYHVKYLNKVLNFIDKNTTALEEERCLCLKMSFRT